MTEHLDPETLAELEAAEVRRGIPVVAVDVDEVLVVFVEHLSQWMETQGYEMHLTRYELEGSMFRKGSDDPLPFEACIALIRQFFDAKTREQRAIPGGAEALQRLSGHAQIVILTNVPRHAAEARRDNLDALGIPFPLVVNSGGKGRAMAWLAEAADAPVAIIDDSVKQIDSVAKHVPHAQRVHFAWAEHIQRIHPACPSATDRVFDWAEAEQVVLARITAQQTAASGS